MASVRARSPHPDDQRPTRGLILGPRPTSYLPRARLPALNHLGEEIRIHSDTSSRLQGAYLRDRIHHVTNGSTRPLANTRLVSQRVGFIQVLQDRPKR